MPQPRRPAGSSSKTATPTPPMACSGSRTATAGNSFATTPSSPTSAVESTTQWTQSRSRTRSRAVSYQRTTAAGLDISLQNATTDAHDFASVVTFLFFELWLIRHCQPKLHLPTGRTQRIAALVMTVEIRSDSSILLWLGSRRITGKRGTFSDVRSLVAMPIVNSRRWRRAGGVVDNHAAEESVWRRGTVVPIHKEVILRRTLMGWLLIREVVSLPSSW